MTERELGSLPEFVELPELDAVLKRHAGEPVLLIRHQPAGLGFLDGRGLIFDGAGRTGICLPTARYVTDSSPKGRTLPGPLPLPDDDVEIIIGIEAVRQYAYRLFMSGGDTLGDMMRSLGLVFPETDPDSDD